jgi:hypothetical protein
MRTSDGASDWSTSSSSSPRPRCEGGGMGGGDASNTRCTAASRPRAREHTSDCCTGCPRRRVDSSWTTRRGTGTLTPGPAQGRKTSQTLSAITFPFRHSRLIHTMRMPMRRMGRGKLVVKKKREPRSTRGSVSQVFGLCTLVLPRIHMSSTWHQQSLQTIQQGCASTGGLCTQGAHVGHYMPGGSRQRVGAQGRGLEQSQHALGHNKLQPRAVQ